MKSTRRGLPVKIRLMGAPDDVAAMADPEVTVIERSAPYTNRRGNPEHVRVYLEVIDA